MTDETNPQTMHRQLVNQLAKNPAEILHSLDAYKVELLHMAVGMTGESGEVLDLVKKCVVNGHDIDRAKLVEEIGDVLFYLHGLCNALDIYLEDALLNNYSKLRARYPDGYSDAASIARRDQS